jgi:hypothetical protein
MNKTTIRSYDTVEAKIKYYEARIPALEKVILDFHCSIEHTTTTIAKYKLEIKCLKGEI